MIAYGDEHASDRFNLHWKCQLIDCLIIDETSVHSRLGFMDLLGGSLDGSMLQQANAFATEAAPGGSTAGAWNLIISKGLSIEKVRRILKNENSFIIQVAHHHNTQHPHHGTNLSR